MLHHPHGEFVRQALEELRLADPLVVEPSRGGLEGEQRQVPSLQRSKPAPHPLLGDPLGLLDLDLELEVEHRGRRQPHADPDNGRDPEEDLPDAQRQPDDGPRPPAAHGTASARQPASRPPAHETSPSPAASR